MRREKAGGSFEKGKLKCWEFEEVRKDRDPLSSRKQKKKKKNF